MSAHARTAPFVGSAGGRISTTRSSTIADHGAGRVKRAVNQALRSTTGYHLSKVPGRAARPAAPAGVRQERTNRLVEEPVFILSSVRSGSTLLRVILNSHSQICAPHELHLRYLQVSIDQDYGKVAMKELGLDERTLEYLLWDRVLERELTASGKQIIVDKTPNIAFVWRRLTEAWPSARYIFLLRHPAAIAKSLSRDRPDKDDAYDAAVKRVKEYADAVEDARAHLPGHVVRYEELVKDPEQITAGICAFLGVGWEPAMLEYGSHDHGTFAPRIGDWGDKIRSGRIDSSVVVPSEDELPDLLVGTARAWGYLG